jgi:hypothetical protein
LKISSLEELDSHPVCGASWERFVLEDLVRMEKLRNLHTQFHFGRTAAGLEADLVFDRASGWVVFETKTGEGERPRARQRLRNAMTDADARRGFMIPQAAGVASLTHGVER